MEMSDISASSEVTKQGAFGDPMKPTVQGLLGPDKLQAILVPGMKDDIYSLCQLLQPNQRTGTEAKIAIFTENGAVVMTSESCQSLIEQAIQQGSQTHIADQIGGIYVLRNASTTLASLSSSRVIAHSSHLDGLWCIRGMVSADCRWTSNFRIVHVQIVVTLFVSRDIDPEWLILQSLILYLDPSKALSNASHSDSILGGPHQRKSSLWNMTRIGILSIHLQKNFGS